MSSTVKIESIDDAFAEIANETVVDASRTIDLYLDLRALFPSQAETLEGAIVDASGRGLVPVDEIRSVLEQVSDN